MKHFQFKIYDQDLIEWLELQTNVSNFIRQTLEDVKSGKIKKQDDADIDTKIKRQKLLSLQLSNWKNLKDNGMIMEEAKAILLNNGEIQEPSIYDSRDFAEPKINGYGFCSICNHEHANTEPKICKSLNCNCEVRQ